MSQDINSDLIIVGGGPSTLLFFLELIRQGKLLSLFKGNGVTILEKSRFFGSGRLESYVVCKVIKGYTTSFDLMRIILKEPHYSNKDLFSSFMDINSDIPRTAQNSQLNTSRNAENSKISIRQTQLQNLEIFLEERALTGFKEVFKTNIYQELIKYGASCPPLTAVGFFLRVVGNTLLRQIKSLRNQLIFRAYHEVQSISLQADGCACLGIKINDPNKTQQQQYLLSPNIDATAFPQDQVSIRPAVLDYYKIAKCKVLLLNLGGKMEYSFIQSNLFSRISNDCKTTSGVFLSDKGFTNSMISMRNRKNKNGNKLLIFGGSHSAFACANLLLKGPCLYTQAEACPQQNDTNITEGFQDSLSPFLQKRVIKNKIPCQYCENLVQNGNNKKRASITAHKYDQHTMQLFSQNNNLRHNSLMSNISENNGRSSLNLNLETIKQLHHRQSINMTNKQKQLSSITSNINKSNVESGNNSYFEQRRGFSQIGMGMLQMQSRPSIITTNISLPLLIQQSQSLEYQQLQQSMNSPQPKLANSSLNSNSTVSTLSEKQQQRQNQQQSESLFVKLDNTLTQSLQTTECLCLGSIKPQLFNWKYCDINLLKFQKYEVVIIHRNPIPIDFQDVLEEQKWKDKEGQNIVISDQGLSGEYKQLYQNIVSGSEKRVKLCHTSNEEEIEQLLLDSYGVIDATGYSTPLISIKGVHGEQVTILKDEYNCIQLDSQRRPISTRGPLRNIYCFGFYSGLPIDSKHSDADRKTISREYGMKGLEQLDSRNICHSVIEALSTLDYQQGDYNWKMTDDITLSKSQHSYNNSHQNNSHRISNNQNQNNNNNNNHSGNEPDYDSANVMDYFSRDLYGIQKNNSSNLQKQKYLLNYYFYDKLIHLFITIGRSSIQEDNLKIFHSTEKDKKHNN